MAPGLGRVACGLALFAFAPVLLAVVAVGALMDPMDPAETYKRLL